MLNKVNFEKIKEENTTIKFLYITPQGQFWCILGSNKKQRISHLIFLELRKTINIIDYQNIKNIKFNKEYAVNSISKIKECVSVKKNQTYWAKVGKR